jgi:hypothetical protein
VAEIATKGENLELEIKFLFSGRILKKK